MLTKLLPLLTQQSSPAAAWQPSAHQQPSTSRFQHSKLTLLLVTIIILSFLHHVDHYCSNAYHDHPEDHEPEPENGGCWGQPSSTMNVCWHLTTIPIPLMRMGVAGVDQHPITLRISGCWSPNYTENGCQQPNSSVISEWVLTTDNPLTSTLGNDGSGTPYTDRWPLSFTGGVWIPTITHQHTPRTVNGCWPPNSLLRMGVIFSTTSKYTENHGASNFISLVHFWYRN